MVTGSNIPSICIIKIQSGIPPPIHMLKDLPAAPLKKQINSPQRSQEKMFVISINVVEVK